jgi:hypothetical protein
MIRKFRVLITGAAVLFLTLTAGLFVDWWFVESAVWLSSISPNQKYTIQLTGNKGRGGFIVYSVVKYNLLKDGSTKPPRFQKDFERRMLTELIS